MDVIKYPIYPILKSGDVVIWDFTNFEKSDKNELLTSNDILQPKKVDDNYLTFCKCHFNVKSLIYEKATPEDVLSGWISANEELKLGRLAKLFLRDSLYNLYLTKHFHNEPDLILVLRLAYWFYRCSRLNSNDSFKYKITEVKRKLTKGLLNQREKINRQLSHHTNNITIVNTLISELEQIIFQFRNNKDIRKELRERSAKYRALFT